MRNAITIVVFHLYHQNSIATINFMGMIFNFLFVSGYLVRLHLYKYNAINYIFYAL